MEPKFISKRLRGIAVFACIFGFVLGISENTNATTYYTFTNGSPTTLTLWWTTTNGTGTHPANFTTAGDIFTIQSGNTMTTSGNWTVTGTVFISTGGTLAVTSTGTTMNFGALTVNSGAVLTENRPMTVTGATNISGTVTFGSTSGTNRLITLTGDVTLNSGAIWNVPATGNGSANTFNFGGNFTNNATTFNDLGTGVHTFSGAAKTISGSTITSIGSIAITGTPTNAGILTSRTALTGAGNLTNGNGSTGTLNIGGTATITTLSATSANNLVNYTGAAQTAKVTTYNNLTVSGTLAKTFATTPTINGVLSMESTATIVVTTGVVTYGSSATLQYNTATARTATTEEWISPFVGSGGIIIKNTGAITTPGAVQIGNNTSVPLNINTGATLTPGANLVTLHGDFINSGAFTSGSGGVTIAGTVTTQSIAGFTTTGTITLTKTAGTATLQGNVNAGPININGVGGTLNLGAGLTHTFTGDVNLTTGSLNGGSSTLNENNLSATAWNGNGTLFSAGTGKVNFGGSAQSLAGTGTTTFNNLTVSNGGLKTFVNVPIVNGVFSVEGTATISAAPTYGSNATLLYNTTTSRTTGVEWITPFVASGGVIIASTGTITMNAAKVLNASAPLTVNSGSSISMSTFLLTLNSNFVNNGGSANGTTGGVTITGTATQSIGSFTTTGTVSMNKTGGVATLTGNINGAALTINGSGGTLNLGTALNHTFTGDITLTAGSLNGNSSTLTDNSISATAWNGTGTLFTPSFSTVTLGATGNQTLSATGLSFYNLSLSGTGTKIFSSVTSIGNNLSISGSAVANLSTFDHTSKSLSFAGTNQVYGTWGSTISGATYKNDTYFTATSGTLNVNCTAPATPGSGGNQVICSGQTIPALSVTVGGGQTANWYSQADGGTLLATGSLTYTPVAPGTFYAEANNSGCLSALRIGVTLTINPLPATLSLAGSTICSSPGGNGTISSTSSQTGANYQLYNGSAVAIGTPKAGTGSALNWSALVAGDGYYVTGINATTSCTSTSSPVNISVNSNPAILSITGSVICTSPGGNGTVASSTSVKGVNYQLYDGGNNPVQSAQPGTGNGLAWANLPAGTGYYVKGTDGTTTCASSNSNAVAVSTTSNPAALALTGSTICTTPDGNGTISSTTSQNGINYQLFDNTDTEVGTPISGTGSGLTWSGLSSGTGYYVVGTNYISLCVSDNSNAVNISTTPNPTITISASATSVCFSASLQYTTLSYSATTDSPTNYTITWNSAAHTAGLTDVTSTALPSSPIAVPVAGNIAGGTYTGTLTVTNAAGCPSSGNSFTVTINTLPGAPTGIASQIFAAGSTVANLSATGTAILWYSAASGGSALSTSLVLVSGNHYYASQTVNGCESSARQNVTAIVLGAGSWIGTTSTNWFTTTNWVGGTLPTSSTNVDIPAGLTNYPSIGTTGAVCNNITVESGATLTIVGTNTLTVSGNWTNSGTFTPNNSTVNFNGSGAGNIAASNFYSVIFSGSGTKTATGILSIGGNVSITGNFTGGSFIHTVGGNWSNSGTFSGAGSTINFNGSGTGNIGTGNFNNITFSGAGTKTATGALTVAGNLSITGNFTAGSFTHTVAGNWTKSGTFTATGSTINFNGSGTANIGASNFNNILFSGSGTKSATGIFNITGAVIISNNFSAGGYSHTIQGNWTNNGAFTANTSTFSFNSSSGQTIAGTSTSTFANIIHNGNGILSLGIASTVSGTLTLTLGTIDIGNYDLTVSSTGAISGGSGTSYVKTSGTGRLKQTVPGAGGSKNFPVGNSAYNPMTVQYNDINTSKVFNIRVSDGAITNANSTKTVNRNWYLSSDIVGTSNLTLTATYNSGEEGSGFSNSATPQIGYFDGSSWAYRAITSGSGTRTFIATGSAPDFSNTSGFFALGSSDAFIATKLAVTNLNPADPTLGAPNTTITIQSQNSNNIPTMVSTATGFSLSCANTTMSTSPTGTIGQYAYQANVSSVAFTTSTYNTGTLVYNHNATETATQTSGDPLTSGTSAVFDVLLGTIYEPLATENWDASNGWRKSTDGGSTWISPASLPARNIFGETDLIRIPAGITLTANVTASLYSMLVYGTLEVNSSGTLTIYHATNDVDYNMHVQGTLKNSGGSLNNSNTAYPFEIQGGTYWHNMNGGSIPVCTFSTLGSTLSICQVQGTGVGGLNQVFENFTLTSGTQTLSGDMTVNGALTLTAGKISTGSYHVIVGLSGTATNSGGGYINGILRRYVASTVTTGDFPVGDASFYAPFSIAVNSGTPSGNGYLEVSTTAAQPAATSGLSQSKYINRKWTISNDGVAGITSYNPSCTFDDGDKVGGPATGSLKLRKLTSAIWYTTNGTATGNTITATAITTAGLIATTDFYAGEDDCSSANTVWLGSVSTDWNTGANWCSGSVPTAITDVMIPASSPRQPVIGSAGGICRNISVESGANIAISGAYSLNIKGNWTNSGTFSSGTGTISFTGSIAQTITGITTFNNLTINNAAGVTATTDFTVNGILNLNSANPDATHGTLDMGSYTLSILSASATVTGTGDVTGIIRRTHTFAPNNSYQFGSQFTTLNFINVGTQPDEISCRINIGNASSWKPAAATRYYSFAQTGTTGTDKAILNLRYLTSELNGNDESKLVLWDHHSNGAVHEHGKTNNSITDHWVGLAGLTIAYISPTVLDNKQWGLSNYSAGKNTWLGADATYPTRWDVISNWSAGHVPLMTEDVLIPAGKPYYPTLTLAVEIKSLEIESAASVNADAYDITINGYNDAWHNTGSFFPGTGTVNITNGDLTHIVIISGTTQFHNIVIAANTFVRPAIGSTMQISGDVYGDPTCIVDLSPQGNTVEYNGTSSDYNGTTTTQYIVNPATVGYDFKGYFNLIVSGTGSKTLVDNLDLWGNFTTNSTLNIGTGIISFIGTIPQTISGTVPDIQNLTINNSAGVNSTADLTVKGILNLQSDNPLTLDKGTLEMASGKILNLGADAITTGTGDVSGIINRTNTFLTNTFYSYGNANQGLLFPLTSGQSLPSSVSVRVTIGSGPCWGSSCSRNPDNVTQRLYELAHIGGTGNMAIFRANYQDNELATGVNESTLSLWSYYTPGDFRTDEGWSNYDVNANYISISNVDFANIPGSTLGDFQVAIAPTSSTFKTWNGSTSTEWNTASNWTPNGVPNNTLGVVIPDANTTVYQPTLPAYGATQGSCQYIIIESNGLLNSGENDNATLTIADGVVGDAWGCEAGGTFNAGNSTVVFAVSGTDAASISGSTNFYNVTITGPSGSRLRPGNGTYMGIAGALDISAGYLGAATNENTIEFKGNSPQYIPNPNGSTPGYHNLILSGSGTKILPATLDIVDEFTNNTSASDKVDAVSNNSTVIFNGIVYGQAISGTTITTFNNLTINNNYGISLNSINAEVDGNLTFTSGKFTTAENSLIIGSEGTVMGAGTGKYVFGNLQKGVAASTTSKIFEIGNSSNYLPTTIDFTGTSTNGTGNLTCSLNDGQQSQYSSSGLSLTKYINRYWTITNSGVTFGACNATFTFINPNDIQGSAALSALLVKKYSGSSWSATTIGTSSSTTVLSEGNTTFGDFVAGEPLSYATDFFRSATTGNWNSPSTWESSSDSITWNQSSLVPDNNAHSITISNGNTVTVTATATASNLYIKGSLLSGSGINLSISGNWSNSGIFNATNGTIIMNGSSAQILTGITTFNNLSINNTAGVTATANQTISGILNLVSANASSTKGALAMEDPFILNMGATATTTGTGDVSGYITRSTFVLSTDYTFGNPFTLLRFTEGPLPTSVTLKIYLRSSDISWKPDAVHRYVNITRSGGNAATRLRFNFHYLDSELNGASEGNLDLFDYHVASATVHDHGFTDFNSTSNWVGFSNVGLAFLGNVASDDHFWTLGTSTTNDLTTWMGGSPSGPTDWDLPGNWEGGVPKTSSHAVIPAGASYYPILPSGAMPDGTLSGGRIINTLEIQPGGTLDATTGTPALTITGGADAWQDFGTLNAGSSTMIFSNSAATMSGITYFNNVTIANGGTLTPQPDNIMNISGTLSLSSSGILNAATYPNTIEYNKSGAQTISLPNGSPSGYYNLFLSGSGIKTLPGSSLAIHGNFILSGSVSTTPASALSVSGVTEVDETSTLMLSGTERLSDSGKITLDSGTFSTGASTGYTETVGTLELAGSSTIVMGSGTHSLTFAASDGVTWASGSVLTITGWAGNWDGTSGTAGQLFVGSSLTGLTSDQLNQVRFFDGSVYYSSKILSSGEIVPFGVASNYTWNGSVNTRWNTAANWSSDNGGIPPSYAIAVIGTGTYQPVVDTVVVCSNLTINSGAVLTITGTGVVTVNDILTNNAGISGLVIQSASDASGTTGTLINGSSGVNATVERWMKGDLWHLISPSATGGQSVSAFAGVSPNANLIARNSTNYALAPYSEGSDSWDYYKISGSNSSGSFGFPGKGYQILRASGAGTGQGNPAYDGVVTFKGSLAGGNQSVGISQTAYGWNLIGNPYPCAMDVAEFLDANRGAINSGYLAIYVSDISDVNTYGYTAINYSSTFKLSSGEGFFVKSVSGTTNADFTQSMKSKTSDAFKSATQEYSGINLIAETTTEKMSTSVKYIPGMTEGLDPGWDAGLFDGGKIPFSIYTRLVEDNGTNFAIQCLPDNKYENLVVPVGLVAQKGSIVTFKASAINLPSGYRVYLEDREKHTFNLLDESTNAYSLTLGSGSSGAGRFYLYTAMMAPEPPVDQILDLKVIPLPEQQKVLLSGKIDLPARASIYDMTGRLLTAIALNRTDENEIPLTYASSGIYLLKIELNNTIVTRKIRWIQN